MATNAAIEIRRREAEREDARTLARHIKTRHDVFGDNLPRKVFLAVVRILGEDKE